MSVIAVGLVAIGGVAEGAGGGVYSFKSPGAGLGCSIFVNFEGTYASCHASRSGRVAWVATRGRARTHFVRPGQPTGPGRVVRVGAVISRGPFTCVVAKRDRVECRSKVSRRGFRLEANGRWWRL